MMPFQRSIQSSLLSKLFILVGLADGNVNVSFSNHSGKSNLFSDLLTIFYELDE